MLVVARVVQVKRKYGLTMDAAEEAEIERVFGWLLGSGDDVIVRRA